MKDCARGFGPADGGADSSAPRLTSRRLYRRMKLYQSGTKQREGVEDLNTQRVSGMPTVCSTDTKQPTSLPARRARDRPGTRTPSEDLRQRIRIPLSPEAEHRGQIAGVSTSIVATRRSRPVVGQGISDGADSSLDSLGSPSASRKRNSPWNKTVRSRPSQSSIRARMVA